MKIFLKKILLKIHFNFIYIFISNFNQKFKLKANKVKNKTTKF